MLVQNIKVDMIQAKKNHNSLKSNFLSTLLADIVRVGKDAGNRETNDQEAIAILKKYLKGIDETLSFMKEDNHTKQALIAEKSIIEEYLPKQLTRDELRDVIIKMNLKDMPSIMKELKSSYSGLYDGKMASELVKEINQ